MTDQPLPPLFDDGKAPDALRTIGEVASALGIRQHVLRYWEEQVPLLSPVKRSGGRRYYRPEDVGTVQLIDRMIHREGYTLRGARLALEGKGKEQPAPLPVASLGTESAILGELRAIRGELAVALAAG